MLPLVRVLETFNSQKCRAEEHGQQQKPDQRFAFACLRRMDSESHSETAGDQNRGVCGAQLDVEQPAAELKRGKIEPTIDGVARKNAPEEHYLGDQKYP